MLLQQVRSLATNNARQDEFSPNSERFFGICIGFGLVLVDILVVKGPLKNAICGHFGEQSSGTGASERRRTRLCGQVATRLVGTIFLILMVRLFYLL